MKIGVLGATGPSGLCVTQQALEKGYDVIALVRNPDGLQIENEKLKKVKVDIMDASTMIPHMEGCDAIMCCLGAKPQWLSAITLHSESTKHIVEAMKKANVKRFIVITAWCTESREGNPFFLEWIFKPLVIGRNLADMARMEQYLATSPECQDINFTAVRPPGLTNDEKTDLEIKVAVEEMFVKDAGGRISRNDVARFMFKCLETNEYDRKCVAITV